MACDARGHVFVLIRRDSYFDPDGPAVAELAPDGSLLAAWGGAEIADGHMLAIGPDGRVYVVDRDAHQIVCRPVLNGAHGLWGDSAGRLYLAELSPTRITRLVPTADD